ncbi:MAG TPA: hypothetical protein VE057_26495 [Archangium sp.]|nr:hypothetical protein [Archangium sp.]
MFAIRLLGFLLLCVSWTALADTTNATLKGWDTVEKTIRDQSPSKMSELNGREFVLELSPNAIQLKITPMAPFELVSRDNRYLLRIVNAAALLESNTGGLTKKQAVSWSATVSGSSDFDIAIAGVDECLFNLTFNQKGGDVLDLSVLRQDYDVTWTFDRPAAIASSDINGGTLQVRRKDGDNADVSVVLRLKSKSGDTDVRSEPVPIQKCARFVRDDNDNPGVIQVRTPGQCVVQSYRKEDEYRTQAKHGINYRTTYRNTCDRPVTCAVSWRQYAYASEADGIARINGTQVSHWPRTLTMAANGEVSENFYLEADAGRPYYSWTNPWLPDAAFPGRHEPDLKCSWVK